MSPEDLSRETVVVSGLKYFDLQAYIGTTKHMGGLAATKELAKLCEIDEGTRVLDVGCGVGATSFYLAGAFGCRVVGVDVHEAMVRQARRRARREGLERSVEFRIADATHLPFDDGFFGAVTGESVVSFIEDKEQVLREVVRVIEGGGYVGLNEGVWLATPPQRLAEFARRAWDIEPLSPSRWVSMFENAGLRDLAAHPQRVSAWREASQLKRYRPRDLARMVWRTFGLYMTRPAFRRYMAERRNVPNDLFDHLAYALIVGRKVRHG